MNNQGIIPGSKSLVGVDVGGTNIRVLIVDQEFNVLSRVNAETDIRSVEKTVESVIKSIEWGLSEAQITSSQVKTVGVGVPGQIQNGIIELAVNLNLESYPLAKKLSDHFGLPFVLENDVRCAALGAYRYVNSRQEIKNLAYLSVGTGVSAGFILNGSLYRGSHGMAGEIGHIEMLQGGPRCVCGASGCLEALVSGPAIANQALAAIHSGRETILSNYLRPTAESVFESARLDDRLAQDIVDQMGIYLSRAIQWILMTNDVDKVVLGGGVSHAGEGFMKPIIKGLTTLQAQSPLASNMLSIDKVVLLPKDYEVGGWGAIMLAKRSSQML